MAADNQQQQQPQELQQHSWKQTAVRVSHASLPVDCLITDCPDPASLAAFADLLASHGVSHLVRICSPTAYDAAVLASAGIAVHDMYFDDGTPPTKQVVADFRSLVQQLTASTAATAAPSAAATAAGTGKPSLAIHCVSGIGRAPVLVCCALIDAGLDPTDAVEFVRSKRRGAVNRVQLSWLLDSSKGFKRAKPAKTGFGMGSKSKSKSSSSSTTSSTTATSNSTSSAPQAGSLKHAPSMSSVASSSSKSGGGLFGLFKTPKT